LPFRPAGRELFDETLIGLRHPRFGPGEYDAGMHQILLAFLKDQTAATAIEYSLIAAGIMLAIVVSVTSIGPILNTTFSAVSAGLK
jgi:pilus assembly protein Flp/PilA